MKKNVMIKLNKLEKELCSDIINTITKKKYWKISIDKTLIIFGRIYGGYILQQLKNDRVIYIYKKHFDKINKGYLKELIRKLKNGE